MFLLSFRERFSYSIETFRQAYTASLFVHFSFRAHSVGDETNSRLVVLRINKNDLDDAHKDKANKIFSSDFKVMKANAISNFCIL